MPTEEEYHTQCWYYEGDHLPAEVFIHFVSQFPAQRVNFHDSVDFMISFSDFSHFFLDFSESIVKNVDDENEFQAKNSGYG